ncbi:MAG TPA: bis(5'-nucleosyl)-tetraphosphatase (symmetrical) YqeK [Candidatus Gastranaerophilaceae bacterium]|nr:bis(5'-nucleosyl)-tetraphosphatase (symmetrical) YqeK [Candidatus Gastranaerophilaceae bacterium]
MDYTNKSDKEILAWLEKNLSQGRFLHSLGCAKRSVELAKKFGQDEKKAYVAGLLHDCAKSFDVEEMRKIIQDKKLDVASCEFVNPKTLHAPLSAYVAKTAFGVEDEEILSAIRWHTLGRVNMSKFEKIIFLADKIEPHTRKTEYAQLIMGILEEENGIDKALLVCYGETIKSLKARGLEICQVTIDVYNSLQSL